MATKEARIVTEVHDEPHVADRRVTVRRIRGLVEEAGRSPVAVAEELDLDLATVYAALQYYHTHPQEMQAAEQRRRRRERAAMEAGAKTIEDYEDGAAGTR